MRTEFHGEETFETGEDREIEGKVFRKREIRSQGSMPKASVTISDGKKGIWITTQNERQFWSSEEWALLVEAVDDAFEWIDEHPPRDYGNKVVMTVEPEQPKYRLPAGVTVEFSARKIGTAIPDTFEKMADEPQPMPATWPSEQEGPEMDYRVKLEHAKEGTKELQLAAESPEEAKEVAVQVAGAGWEPVEVTELGEHREVATDD